MDSIELNRRAWDNLAKSPEQWFRPVTAAEIENARDGQWQIRLTAVKPIPRTWIEPTRGRRVLCLAGGGGHQAPILAAAGAEVTVFDLSDEQLGIDRSVASREGLEIETRQGDMCDLSCFADQQFDLIVNPCSVCFTPDPRAVWRECFRVLKPGGILLSGFLNPINYLFDAKAMLDGDFVVKHKIPYSDLDLPKTQRQELLDAGRPIEFGHTLADLLGGQTAAGFGITDLFEDRWGGGDPLSRRIAVFIATRAVKPIS